MKYYLFKFLILLHILLELNLSFLKIDSNACDIKIKIKQAGIQTILGRYADFKLPDEIYLGGSKIGKISRK